VNVTADGVDGDYEGENEYGLDTDTEKPSAHFHPHQSSEECPHALSKAVLRFIHPIRF